jgi:hypothetical protein
MCVQDGKLCALYRYTKERPAAVSLSYLSCSQVFSLFLRGDSMSLVDRQADIFLLARRGLSCLPSPAEGFLLRWHVSTPAPVLGRGAVELTPAARLEAAAENHVTNTRASEQRPAVRWRGADLIAMAGGLVGPRAVLFVSLG